MDPLKCIENLAETARRETPPRVDVASAVMLRVQSSDEREAGRVLAWPLAAGLSLATAASFAVAFYAWSSALDPYLQFLAPVGMATP